MLGRPIKPVQVIKDLQDLNARYEHIVNEQWLIIDQRNTQQRRLEAFIDDISKAYNEIIGKLTGGKCDRWSLTSDIMSVNEEHIAAKYGPTGPTRHVAIPALSLSVWNGPSIGSSGQNGGTSVHTLPTGQSMGGPSVTTGGTPAPGAAGTGYIQIGKPTVDTGVASPMKVCTNDLTRQKPRG